MPGRSYALSGQVSKLEDGQTTIMHVNYDINHQLLPAHNPAGNGNGRIKVQWLLAMGAMDIPHDTNFVAWSRIALVG
ncbi:hypothetical protein KEM48_012681 [Puccinia striiformis f. sp. tritici PST-130]|nr:hypothetical protein KEM48_012681 [Puccinia striiformis f. sp. tritici PST-130]